MYQSSLQKLIPTGDTSSSASESGDATQSKTPAGVKLAAANLSIDDDDFKDNLYITFAAVAKSIINTHFANMEGEDMMKLSDDEREILLKGGLEFPQGPDGEMSNEMQVVWDTVRAKFSFEVDPEQDKAKDDADRLEGLTRVAEIIAADPTLDQDLAASGKKLNKGELFAEIIALTSDNDKIVADISPDEQKAQQEQGQQGQPDPQQEQAMQQSDEKHQLDMQSKQQDMEFKNQKAQQSMQAQAQPEQPQEQPQISPEEIQANVEAIMQQFNVDENTALTALAAEAQGFPQEDVIAQLEKYSQVPA